MADVKAEKPKRYKDMVREQIMHASTAEDVISSDEDGENGRQQGWDQSSGARGLAYDEEQQQLRESLLGSIAQHDIGKDEGGSDDDSDGEDLLKVTPMTIRE